MRRSSSPQTTPCVLRCTHTKQCDGMARRGVLFGAQGPGYYDAREGSVAAVNAGSAMLQVRVPCCAAAANVDACSVARHTARPCRQQVLVKVCMYALCVCVCVCFDTGVLDCVYMCACLGVWWLCTHPGDAIR